MQKNNIKQEEMEFQNHGEPMSLFADFENYENAITEYNSPVEYCSADICPCPTCCAPAPAPIPARHFSPAPARHSETAETVSFTEVKEIDITGFLYLPVCILGFGWIALEIISVYETEIVVAAILAVLVVLAGKVVSWKNAEDAVAPPAAPVVPTSAPEQTQTPNPKNINININIL